MPAIDSIVNEILELSSPDDAQFLQRFFKTGPGQYAEGDKFLGVRNPQLRQVAKKYYAQVSNSDLLELLHNEYHEVRLCALVMTTMIMPKSNTTRQKQLYDIYLQNITNSINNWDLVDISAPHIVGTYLLDKDRQVLYELARASLWEKRVAIIATFAFIRQGDFSETIKLSELLLHESHDLLHKAVGWMLREVGKRDLVVLLAFLDKHAAHMPRTTLRYAIEKLPNQQRKLYMSMKNNKP